MHVTGGQYKGVKVIIPSCAKPTLSKTRESIFNILYSIFGNFENKVFLDMFAGSGIISLEALSRGFSTISIDKNPLAIKTIKENLKIAKGGYKIIKGDSTKIIENFEIAPDVIYIDPPWEINYEDAIIKAYKKFSNAIIIIEYDKKRMQEFSHIYGKISAPFREKVYGRCKLDFIKNQN